MICFVDYRISDEELLSLKNLNFDIIKIPKDHNLYSAIDGHVDIQLNILNKSKKEIIINKNLPQNFKDILTEKNINFIEASSRLSHKYPNNISLNAYITENYLVHNLKFTDEIILNHSRDKKLINIKQGYSKCSILPIRENVIITNDNGIYKTSLSEDFEILYLPFGDIILPGLNYGFIGGVGGMINDNTMAFFGSLEHYSFGEEIKKFLYKYDVKPIYLNDGKLVDRGSLFVL